MRGDLIGLGLACALLFGLALGARDLWHPNEPTYAQAVAEMRAGGDGLVPTVNGLPFAEKPILYFWLALGAAALLGGVSESALRLPSAAAGVAAVLMLYLLVRSYADARRARTAAGLLATTYIVFWSARSVQMDLLLCACTLGAVWAATRVLDRGGGRYPGWAAAGAVAGLGFLAKGPVGLICPAIVVVIYLGLTGRLRELRRAELLAFAATFVIVGAPWYVALLWRGETAFVRELLFRQNVERFLYPWDHAAPWWYFLQAFFVDMLPWSLFVPLALGLAALNENERRLHRLAWAWLVGTVFFFSLSQSKRSPYILPAAPAAAILASAVFERWRAGHLDRRRRRIALGLLVAVGLGLLSGARVLTSQLDRNLADPAELRGAALVTVVLLLSGGLAVLAGAVAPWRERLGAPLALFGFAVLSYLVAAVWVLPALDAVKSHRPFGQAIVARVGSGEPLFGYRLWKWRAAYSFYSGRQIRSLETPEDLQRYWKRPERVFLVVERGMLAEAAAAIDLGPQLASRAAGNNFVYLFGKPAAHEGRPPQPAPDE